MAKILVADDNSNIQRMVGLALKDQGIDVVAVGNGEAAVRKISELRPDLVLADVFMPVRNGYEVCQYVKEDSSLAHIPVILLVGAFDPLDEQEAQRVGADGVLKKPFVPPDPLIAMVKSALLKAGVSLSPGGSEKISLAPQRKAADLLPPPQPSTPISSPLAGVAFSGIPTPETLVGDESFVDMPARQEPVKIDATKHTMAFGNLLGSTATSEDPGFAAVEESEPVRGSDWRAAAEPDDASEEEEESKESVPSWRRDGIAGGFNGEDANGPVKDWCDSAIVQTAGRKSDRETWEPAEEKGGFVTAADVPTEMGGFPTETVTADAETLRANAQLTQVGERGVSEISQPESAPQSSTFPDAEAPAIVAEPDIQPMELPRESVTNEVSHTEAAASGFVEAEVAELSSSELAGAPVLIDTAETAVPVQSGDAERPDDKVSEKAPANSWFSRPTSPWDSEPHKTNTLAASWDTGSASRESALVAAVKDKALETPNSNGESSPDEVARVLSDESATEVISRSAAPATDAEMDALVSKVLARITPEVLQAISREILKPVVAAILGDELKSKK